MADAIYAPSQFRFAIAQQAAWGTENSTQTEFYELDITIPVQPDMASGVIEDSRKRSDGSIVAKNTDTYRSVVGGTYSIPFECIATEHTIDLLLYGVMQDLVSSTNVSTEYNNIWEWDGDTVSPDFSANAGLIFTLRGYDPSDAVASTQGNWMAESCILKSLTLSASPGTNGGRLTASGEFITGFPISTAETSTVSDWVSPGTEYFPFQLYTSCLVAAANLVPYSFSLVFDNSAVRVGNAAGLATNYRMMAPVVTCEITAKLDAITADLEDKYILSPSDGSAEDTVTMAWGAVDADGGLSFVLNAEYTGPLTRDFGPESGVGVTLSYKGVHDATPNEAIEVKQTNQINRGW